MFFVFILPLVLALLALMSLLVAWLLWIMWKVGLLRRPWQFVLAMPAMLITIPAWAFWQGRLQEAECYRVSGPGELSCGGELGGVFIDTFMIGLISLGLLVGPIIGHRLACSWLTPRGPR
ncbi:hypothetical protein ACFSTD_09505 [Novosphingobium colocasiae]|uniref:hypothetical protein n=1 Tax=Novosphingobium colocasiae TaxID=1256513 RepID=UPI00167B5546|nr:hypothetical protein [Novosphingobium colocasiae]